MSSKRNRHLMLRKTMAGLLSMAMVVTIVTPASGNAYASALDEETAKAVLEQVAEPSDSETPEAEPVAEEEAPAEAAEEAVPEEAVADEITGETVDLYAAQSVFKNEDVESIQAFTDYNFYGLRLNRIVIQFRNGTNMTGAGNAENYKVWDRAFQKGEFEEAGAKGAIESVDVEGFTVTLNFSQDPAGNEAFGMMCTSLWAVAETSEGTYEIKSKGQGDGKDYQYFTRENLDLVLGLGQAATQEEGIASTDTFGHMLAGTVWQEQDNGIYDEFNLTWVDAADEEDATRFEAQDGKVPVHYYVPDSYDADEGMPLVLYVTGNGTSYWEAWDGDSHKIGDGKVISNNLGTNVSFDEAVSQWAETGEVIVASPDVHSDKNKSAATDVANTIKYFQENYNISKVILSGNSNGTGITSQCVRDYTELVDVFLNYNGWFGDGPNQIFSSDRQKATWPEESVQHIADEGVAIWFFNGEKDPLANPQFTVNAYKQLIPYYQAAGWSDKWIADNLRISGFKDYKFVEWGVSDHSVTKVVASNYITSPYRDVYEDGGLLNVGDNYYMSDATRDDVKQFAYTVYSESVKDWALGDHSEGHTATPIEESAAAPASIGSYQKRNGYFTYQVTVGETTREVELYIPDGARQREYWICMTLPNGVNSTQFLENANWFETADQDSACLLIMKPENGTWGNVEDEMAYVNAAMGTLASNGKYYSAFTYDYLVGYGEGAPALQLWAAQNPLKMISQVYVNAQADAAYDALLKEAGDTQVGQTPQPNNMNFDGYKDKDGNEITQKRTFAAQSYKDIPIPTWFIGNTSESIVNYWKDANDCAADGTADASYGTIYWQSEDSDAIATSFSDIQTQVAVQENAEDVYGAAATESIYDFLTYYSGYDNNSVYGHFITKRLDYNDAIESGNLKAVDHEWNGTVRSYLVYVPDSVKKMDGPAPVVFANHGAGQTAFVFMEATDIKEAADKYGFIAVTFDVTSNADYMADLYEMVKADCEEMGVTMDESRVYAYGQSAGGGSVANTMAQSKKVVDLFAAFGMTSGIHTVAQADGSDKIVPMYAIYGEYDYWPMKLGAIGAGEWTGSQKTQYAWTTDTQSYWANRLLGMTLDELTDENNYTVVDGIGASLVPENTPISLITNPTATANRYKTYTWSLADGTPIFNWSQCYGRGHNLIPTDLDELWTKWYSKWQKVDDSTVAYWADGVGNGESVLVNQYPAKEAEDLDAFTTAPIDYSKSALIPLTGWYNKNIDVNGVQRTVKIYASEYAACRTYITVVAVPDGVDSYRFCEEQGWFDLMEARGEVLAVLEPGEGGWKSAADELSYINAAMSFIESGKNANGVVLFTNYSTFYFVGYENGAAPLESWAVENPIKVDSQAYVGGESVGSEYLAEVGSKIYDGTNTGGYDPGIADLDTFKAVLKTQGYDDAITRSDVPVPTWFMGYAAEDASVAYWKNANDCLSTADGETFWQNIDSDAFQTLYANSCLDKNAGHGIAQVKVSEDAAAADAIADFLYSYSRYNVPFAYSNHLSERQDYTAARVAAQKAAAGVTLDENSFVAYEKPVTSDAGDVYEGYYLLARERSEIATGTFESGIFAASDDNKDGVMDAHEYLMYIPNSVNGKTPVVYQFPGNTQSVSVGFDSTQWWRIANEEGVIIVIMSEAYANGVALTWKNPDMNVYVVNDILANQIDGKDADIDWTRIYGSGHSAGSSRVQTYVRTHPDFFAAVGSTSFDATAEGTYETVPTMLVIGQSDLPFLVNANNDPMDCDLWSVERLQNWFGYLAKANDLKVSAASRDNADVVDESGRTFLYTWNNKQEIPMVQFGQTLLREHNCYPAEVPMAWDFISKYSKAEDGTRYYSESAFVKDDLIEIEKEETAEDLDAITKLPYDFSQAAQLPLTGYFTKAIGEEGRTVKVYISEEASIRSYFTVVAVPDGVSSTTKFLEENGWFDLADAKGEGLIVLEPADGKWGTREEEQDYVNAAMSFARSGRNANNVPVFSVYGEFYLVGYGASAAPLEAWAAEWPIYVISQVYIDGTGAGRSYLDATGAKEYDGTNTSGYDGEIKNFDSVLAALGISERMKKSDVPVPTWFIGYNENDYSITYWKQANDAIATTEAGVYRQSIKSTALQTEYANATLRKEQPDTKYGIAQVKVSNDGAVTAEDIYSWMSIYTRYDNTFAYSNALGYRLDYTAATVAAQQAAKNLAADDRETLTFKMTGGEKGEAELWSSSAVKVEAAENAAGSGTVIVGIASFADNGGLNGTRTPDGVNDPREYIFYVPDSAKEKAGENGAPAIVIYPGNSQTDRIFMDSTMWWKIADEEGIVLAFVCETYSNNSVSVSHANQDLCYYTLRALLEQQISEDYVKVDTNRIYGSGQSAGSSATQTFVRQHPEFYAAAASTSFAVASEGVGEYIPTYLQTGQSDLGNLLPDLWGSTTLQGWIEYLFKANGLDTDINSWTSAVEDGRYHVYTWENHQGIPMVQWGQTQMRVHNCYPAEMPLLWNFMKHYSYTTDENGYVTARYYSESAFAEDDLVEIEKKAPEPVEPVAPTGVEGFVTRLYENVLGRTPDQKGLDAWVNVLKNGTNGGEEVAKGFIFSDEYTKKNTSNDAFVEMLYNTLLNRKSDAAGKKAWVAQLDNKLATREEIVEGFIHSNEFIGICGEYGIFTTAAEAFAARLYTKCLGRSYDKKGLKAWADLLHSRKIGGGEAAKGFFFSDEFQNMKLDNKEFVTRCYRTFLNREPDAQGLANWMNVLAQSNDRASVLDGFIGSSEYAKLCVSYGIDK